MYRDRYHGCLEGDPDTEPLCVCMGGRLRGGSTRAVAEAGMVELEGRDG